MNGNTLGRNALKVQIEEAFGGGDFPREYSLLYDENCRHDECEYIRHVFARRPWKDVIETEKLSRDDLFLFFSAKAFQYYLPAFMFMVIDRYEEADVMVDALMRALRRSDETGLLPIERLSGQIVSFDDAQRQAIASFISFTCESYKDEEACRLLKSGGCN